MKSRALEKASPHHRQPLRQAQGKLRLRESEPQPQQMAQVASHSLVISHGKRLLTQLPTIYTSAHQILLRFAQKILQREVSTPALFSQTQLTTGVLLFGLLQISK